MKTRSHFQKSTDTTVDVGLARRRLSNAAENFLCLRILRAEVWALDDQKTLHRVAVRRSDSQSLEGAGRDNLRPYRRYRRKPHRLHEKITVSGGDLKENGFARITEVGRLNSPSEKFQAFRVR